MPSRIKLLVKYIINKNLLFIRIERFYGQDVLFLQPVVFPDAKVHLFQFEKVCIIQHCLIRIVAVSKPG